MGECRLRHNHKTTYARAGIASGQADQISRAASGSSQGKYANRSRPRSAGSIRRRGPRLRRRGQWIHRGPDGTALHRHLVDQALTWTVRLRSRGSQASAEVRLELFHLPRGRTTPQRRQRAQTVGINSLRPAAAIPLRITRAPLGEEIVRADTMALPMTGARSTFVSLS